MGRAKRRNKRKEVMDSLRYDGWRIARKGPRDQVQYTHPGPGRITIDIGKDDIPTPTLRSVYRQAGWTW